MKFDELLDSIWDQTELPGIAKQQLSGSLSGKTKKKMTKMEPESVVRIIRDAVDKVDKGSAESLDRLINAKIW